MSLASNLRINLIAAACSNNGIGINGKLPWRLKRDMNYFNTMTTTTIDPNKQNAVIMGRKTWISIPAKMRPLKNRINIVLSTQMNEETGIHVAKTYEDALDLLTNGSISSSVESVYVIGGSSVYKKAMDTARHCRIYFTDVKMDVECDAFFPNIDPAIFRKLDHEEFPDAVPREMITENDISYTFEIFDKIVE